MHNSAISSDVHLILNDDCLNEPGNARAALTVITYLASCCAVMKIAGCTSTVLRVKAKWVAL